ncbi:50S ribosomal protein L10 [Candidatus Gracilibacteria bacterium]|nr:50S ribosomal protein L10 [Candidatus Gracilibacteria bacterium]
MAVTKAKKAEQLLVLEAHLKTATSVAFTSNTKVTVLEISALKKDLRAENAIYLTAKKTLIRIAFKTVYGVDVDLATLPGQVGLVISKGDALTPFSVANKYATEWKKEQKMTFVAGYMEGRLMDATETAKLATLPSREVLLAKLLGSMMSPLSGLARFFDAAGKDLTAKSLTKVGDLIGSGAAPAPVVAEVAVEAPAAVAVSEVPGEATPVVAEVAVEAPAA